MPEGDVSPPNGLTPTEELLLAYSREGLRHAEMAVRLGIPISSVKARFEEMDRRARQPRPILPPDLPAVQGAGERTAGAPGVPGGSSLVVSLALAAIALAGVAFYYLVRPGEGPPQPLDTEPARFSGESRPTEIDLLVAALGDRRTGHSRSLQFGAPAGIDTTFALITKSRVGPGQFTGLDRVYIPPGESTAIREPLYRVPEGAQLATAAGSFDGSRIVVIYEDVAGAWLAWSADGGASWQDPIEIEHGTLIGFVGSQDAVLSSPDGKGWLALGDSGGIMSLRQPPGTEGPPVAQLDGELLWRSKGATLVTGSGRTALDPGSGPLAMARLNAFGRLYPNDLAVVLWSDAGGVYTSLVEPGGSVASTLFSPPWNPAGTAATLRVLGNHCPAAYPETETPGLPCVAVLFHPGTGVLHSLVDEAFDPDQYDPNPVVASQPGPFALVPRGECVPLFVEPAGTATATACAAPGRLLTLANPADLSSSGPSDPHFVQAGGRTWLEVLGSGGVPLWVDTAAVRFGFVPPFP